MGRTVTLVVFLILSQIAYAQQSGKLWLSAMESYNYQQAIELISHEIVQVQDTSQIRSLLLQKAVCEKNLYKFSDAITTLTDALSIVGDDPAVFASLADCHRLNGNNNIAMIFYTLATETAPDNLYYKIQKAMLQYRMDDLQGCILEGKKILGKDSTYSIVTMMGDCFNKLQATDSALVYYNWAYDKNPGDYRVLEKLSGIYLGQKDFARVARMTSDFLKSDSTNVTITPILGVALHGMSKYDESCKVFGKALELGCDKLSGYYYMGLNKMMLEDYLSAYDWFRKAALLDTADVNLVYYMGYCRSKTLHGKVADSLFNKVEQMLQPDPAMMFKLNISRAEMYVQYELYGKGADHFIKAEQYASLTPAQIAKAGYAYRLAKDYKNALKFYKRYLSVGKEGSVTWKFVQSELAFIKEEQFMAGE